MAKTLILITGANQGLGYYAAQQLGATGKYHVLVGSRDVAKAHKAIESIIADNSHKNTQDNFEPLQIDVTDDQSIQDAVSAIESKHGKLDILLNNAGIAGQQEATGSALRKLYQEHYNTNVFGAAVTSEAFLPLLRKGDKRLGFTSSGLGSITQICEEKYGPAIFPVYSSTKSALNSVMIHYAKRLESEGFIVSSADPGYCTTNLNGNSGPKDPREGAKALIRCISGSKEDVHAAVVDETSKLPW